MTDNVSETAQERSLQGDAQTLDNSPGSQLRRAREEAGLSREELSRRLCMIGNKLELLERDQYDRLPGPIYVRGYIRNACKELGIDAEPVLQAFSGYCSAEDTSREIVSHVSRGVPLQARRRSYGGLLLLPLLIAGAAFWWLNGREAAPVAQAPAADSAQLPALGSEPGEPEPPSLAAEMEPEQPVGEVSFGGDIEAPTGDGAPVQKEVAAEPLVADRQAPSEAVGALAETPAPAAAETAPAQAADSVEDLQLNFDEESWVEVKDATGAVLLAKLQPAGSEVSLSGQAPFQLMLGNARSTQVRYRGELIDSAPIGNRRTRRLTVGE